MPQDVFYSWQSDLPNSSNRGFIQDALEGAASDLRKDAELGIDPRIDRDTAGAPGAPDIGQTILAKIDRAVAIVCDVSIVHDEAHGGRRAPNPNVLIELGYALKSLGHERTLLVMNTAFGKPELLAFDLRQKRVITYDHAPGSADGAARKKELRAKLAAALKGILSHHAAAAAVVEQRGPLADALEGVSADAPNLAKRVNVYMRWLAGELEALSPKGEALTEDDALVAAIDATVPLMRGFGELAEQVASMGSALGAKAIYKGFERILAGYWLPKGFSGSYRESDFDFFKFVGHESFVTFCAALVR